MDFGHLENPAVVDYHLPEVPGFTEIQLSHFKPTTEPNYIIGCPVWGVKQWRGSYYPAKAQPADYLKHYAQLFPTIELNVTHYGMPKPDTLQKWFAVTPDDFTFCAKLPQTISHYRKLKNCFEHVQQFLHQLAVLQHKQGPCFLQLPPTFTFAQAPDVYHFLNDWPQGVPLHIEFRHQSWFTDNALAEWPAELAAHEVGTVVTDTSGRRDVLHLYLTNPTLMVRFVGNHLHPTDFVRLKQWVQRLKELNALGLQQSYFFMHQPDNIYSPQAIEELYRLLALPREANALQQAAKGEAGAVQQSLF